ncbi:uncharacterized protein LTR77_002530 [Saxophila tyrrhenica]|uniref:Uncharacterized protein n=1 Tax=Saxophila tyrrhenica TaxID=1690608 RepID=A0AAV9PIX5_9PEZI|nr:hypothetical protein LTR77_002530 [Saxophila tyrrhenica]
MWYFSPTGSTSGGAYERAKLLGDWKGTQIKEGDLEEEETDTQRKQERAYKERNKAKLRKGNVP